MNSERVIFLPNKIERLLRAKAWEVNRALVIRVDKEDPGLNPYRGSLGGKFKIVTAEPRTVTFSAYDADDVIQAVRSHLGKL